MHRLLIATRNAHKTTEFATILGRAFSVVDLTTLPPVPAVEETGTTFEENAALKATAASRQTSELVVADDSGLEVAALGGAPGIHSARYAGPNATDEANVAKLLAALEGKSEGTEECLARFRCALALARDGTVLHTAEGSVAGSISRSPFGTSGFGYDPIFVPFGFSRTFSELPPQVKNRISHRARAIAKLAEFLARDAV